MSKRYKLYVLQESRLSAVERARLYHWVLGHRDPEVPVRMTKSGLADGIEVTHCLNEDCVVCVKAKFRQLSFPRNPLESRIRLPPYHTIFVDGFGGQSSFRVKSFSGTELVPSYHGAVGGYVFVDGESDDIDVKLYSKKSQFPNLLRAYLVSVLAQMYVVRVLVIDNASELYGTEVEELAEEFDFVIRPAAPYTPQGNSLAENGVGIVCSLIRSLMIGAPHLPANRWGLAAKYAALINFVLPKKRNGGRTPYEVVRSRKPNIKRMFYKVFGAPVQYKVQKPKDKIAERTADGYFVGIEWPSALIDDRSSKTVLKRSVRKVRVFQGAYRVL
jgi:hypothetical protein